MSNLIAPSNVAFDPSSFSLRYHLSTFPTTKLTPAEENLKQEKIAVLGEQYQTYYTPGMMEVGEAEVEMLTVVWKDLLAALPDPFSSATFPVTGNERHPSVRGSYTLILDDCGIIGTKHGIEAGEKANRITFKMRVMRTLYRGSDNVWKTMARRPGVSIDASAAAQSLMKF
jgi:hypothetical protein